MCTENPITPENKSTDLNTALNVKPHFSYLRTKMQYPRIHKTFKRIKVRQ